MMASQKSKNPKALAMKVMFTGKITETSVMCGLQLHLANYHIQKDGHFVMVFS